MGEREFSAPAPVPGTDLELGQFTDPEGHLIGQFTDPEGHLIGLMKAAA